MNYPKCDHCERDLEKWSGNVMVRDGDGEYPNMINELLIWCKDCTKKLDDAGVGRRWHNIWELSWVKESYFEFEKDIFENLLSEEPRWSIKALKKFNELGRIRFGQPLPEEEYEE